MACGRAGFRSCEGGSPACDVYPTSFEDLDRPKPSAHYHLEKDGEEEDDKLLCLFDREDVLWRLEIPHTLFEDGAEHSSQSSESTTASHEQLSSSEDTILSCDPQLPPERLGGCSGVFPDGYQVVHIPTPTRMFESYFLLLCRDFKRKASRYWSSRLTQLVRSDQETFLIEPEALSVPCRAAFYFLRADDRPNHEWLLELMVADKRVWTW